MKRGLSAFTLWLAPFAFGACSTAGTGSPVANSSPDAAATAPNGVIVRVVDGDTVDIDFDGREERVRLIGVDTPETKKPNTPIECFGPEASAYTASLLAGGTPVRVLRDVEARDDYGRLLAYVYRASDGLFVNLALVEGGYAQPLTIAPNVSHSREFVRAAHDAEAADKGMWATCSG